MSLIVLVAAGTGGHINSAIALGEFFSKKNHEILYVGGVRPLDYKLFKNQNVLHLKSSTIRNKGLLSIIGSLFNNLFVFFKMFFFFINKRPHLILGAGGYVCGPVVMAGFVLGIPIYVLEQNSIMGLTNKILSFFAKKVFVNFKETQGGMSNRSKFVMTGNPVRKEILSLDNEPVNNSEHLNVLILGGSLGAKSVNEMISEYVSEKRLKFKINLRHQVGSGKEIVTEPSKDIIYNQLEYMDDIAEEYEWCDVIICRSGASTVAELRYLQKPTIFIPYPFATDNHQFYNATFFKHEATFPIAINSVEELKKDDFNLLNRLLIDYKPLRNRVRTIPSFNAEDEIWKEIRNDL